jgi:hypothetical protein
VLRGRRPIPSHLAVMHGAEVPPSLPLHGTQQQRRGWWDWNEVDGLSWYHEPYTLLPSVSWLHNDTMQREWMSPFEHGDSVGWDPVSGFDSGYLAGGAVPGGAGRACPRGNSGLHLVGAEIYGPPRQRNGRVIQEENAALGFPRVVARPVTDDPRYQREVAPRRRLLESSP